MAKAAIVKPASVANATTPPACSRDLSRRARSSSRSAFPSPAAWSSGTAPRRAECAAQGAGGTLVPCTLGGLGEIIPPDLANLAWDRENRLGEHRIGELAAACAALGVSDHRFLGGPGHWHDSGMMGTPSNDWDGAFWRADVSRAPRVLLEVINHVLPHLLGPYDSNGYSGHPDHIQAHRVAWRAFRMADGLVRQF